MISWYPIQSKFQGVGGAVNNELIISYPNQISRCLPFPISFLSWGCSTFLPHKVSAVRMNQKHNMRRITRFGRTQHLWHGLQDLADAVENVPTLSLWPVLLENGHVKAHKYKNKTGTHQDWRNMAKIHECFSPLCLFQLEIFKEKQL